MGRPGRWLASYTCVRELAGNNMTLDATYMKTTGTSGIFMPTSLACPLYCGRCQLWVKLPL